MECSYLVEKAMKFDPNSNEKELTEKLKQLLQSHIVTSGDKVLGNNTFSYNLFT